LKRPSTAEIVGVNHKLTLTSYGGVYKQVVVPSVLRRPIVLGNEWGLFGALVNIMTMIYGFRDFRDTFGRDLAVCR
jgi:hypothetical protein